MMKLGKVSIETRGIKLGPLSEPDGQPEIADAAVSTATAVR